MVQSQGFALIAVLISTLIFSIVAVLVINANFDSIGKLRQLQAINSPGPSSDSPTIQNLKSLQTPAISNQSKLICDLDLDGVCDESDQAIFDKEYGICNSLVLKSDLNLDGCVDNLDKKLFLHN